MIPIAELLPDAEELAEAQRERLAERAAGRLRQSPELRRACVIEPAGDGAYLAGVAVPLDGGIATAVLRVPDADPFALIDVFDRVCSSTAALSAKRRAAPASAHDDPHNPRTVRQ